MIKDIFVVRDTKVGAFATPFYLENISVAMRAFAHAANDPTTDVGRYPSDFSLYHLGTYDDETAKFDLMPEPFHLALASTLVEVK